MPPAETLEPGQRFGHYELRERLGQDPFCTAWHATHVVRKYPALLRVVREFLARPTSAPGLNHLPTFTHPNLLEVLEVCANIAMPHVVYRPVSGERLDEALVRGPMGWERVAPVADGLLAGLAALHESGNCVGRLSPDLVVLSDDGVPRLDGAGVQALVSDEYQKLLSSQDPLACPDHYLSPQGDLWSLGTLVWCALSAKLPPPGDLPPLWEVAPGAPPEMAHFVARCRGESDAGPYEAAAEARLDLAPMLAPPDQLVFPAGAPMAEEEAPAPEEVAPEAEAPPPPSPPGATEGEPAEETRGAHGEGLASALLGEEALEAMEAQLGSLEHEIQHRGARWPQGEAQADALRETIGHAWLRVLEGTHRTGVVRRHGLALAAQSMLIPLGMVAVMGLLAGQVVVSLVANETMPAATRWGLGAAALGGTAVVAAWLVVNLGLQRLVSRGLVEVTPNEVIVRQTSGREVTDRLPARLLARVEVVSAPVEGVSGATVRLVTREGPDYTLRFDAPRSSAPPGDG